MLVAAAAAAVAVWPCPVYLVSSAKKSVRQEKEKEKRRSKLVTIAVRGRDDEATTHNDGRVQREHRRVSRCSGDGKHGVSGLKRGTHPRS